MQDGPGGFDDRYLVGRVVGRGGVGVVYRATDRASGRDVALKVLSAVDPGQEDRFQREVAALKALRHPHIVRVLDVGRGNAHGQFFIAMDLLRGKTLAELCKEGPLAPSRAVRLALQLLSALERAHDLGIIHRDLKPGNLFVVNAGATDETLKILDFGLARAIDAPSLTKTGEILGTPAYMAPEQARGQRVDARTDVYGAGGCLYAALAGRGPIHGEPPMRQVVRAMAGDTTPLLEVAPRVPEGLAALVARAMNVEPAARFASAAAMREALATWRAEGSAPPAGSRVLRGTMAIGLAIAASASGYVAIARLTRRAPPHAASARVVQIEAPTPEPSIAPLLPPRIEPTARATSSVRGPGRTAPASTFPPCSRDADCGELEKCYPGGCSCISGVLRCGTHCRRAGTTHADCGCSACKPNEMCTVSSDGPPRCRPCPAAAPCSGD
ncbi:MAG: serine/threonine protein kinase [Polyangiaceae bacterium]|nr:serine/threonine protein kinase [Polyangiaceae bacterium]